MARTANESLDPSLELYLRGLKMRDEKQSLLEASLSDAVTVNPSEFAERQRLASVIGVNPDSVDEFRDAAKQASMLLAPGISQLSSTHPATSAFLSEPDNAKVGHTSVQPMSKIESLFTAIKESVTGENAAARQDEALSIYAPEKIAGALGAGALDFGSSILGAGRAFKETFGGTSAGNPLLMLALKEEAKKQVFQAQGLEAAQTGIRDLAASIRPEQDPYGILAGVESVAANVPTMAVSFFTGPAVGLTVMGAVTGGQSYAEAREKGLSPAAAFLYGAVQGGIEAATEKIPVGRLIKDLQVGAPLHRMVMHQLMTDLPGEQAATALQDFVEWATLNQDKPFSSYVESRPAAIVQTFGATLVSALTFSSISKSAQGLFDHLNKIDRSKKTVEVQQQLKDLVDNAELTKVAPSSMSRFLNQVVRGSASENVYIDQTQFAESMRGVDLSAFPDLVSQIGGAQDIVIPTGTYYAQIAPEHGSKLDQHIKFGPDQFSLFELPEVEKDAEEMNRQVEQQITEEQQKAAEFDNSAKELEAKLKQGFGVASDVVVSPKGAGTVAKLTTEFYKSIAKKTGLTPMQAYEKYPLTMQRVQEAEVGVEAPASLTVRAEGAEAPASLTVRTEGVEAPASLTVRTEEPPPTSDVTFQQQSRGAYNPETLQVLLYEGADISSIVHELGHGFLDITMDIASQPDAPADMVEDMQTTLEWFGVPDMATWNSMSLEERRQFHEQFAYNWEKYAFSGDAPTPALKNVFQRFTEWIKDVYQNTLLELNNLYRQEFGKDLPAMTTEMRMVFDRILGAEKEFTTAQATEGMAPAYETKPESMTDEAWAAYQQLAQDARNEGIEILTQASLRQLKWYGNARGRVLRGLQGQVKELRKKMRETVAKEVAEEPVYQLMNFLKTGMLPGETAQMAENFKLKLEGVQELYPDGLLQPAPNYRKLGFGKNGMLSKGTGIDPDALANIFKLMYPDDMMFGSGDAMVRALVNAPKLNDAIEARTDERMLQEHSDLLDPQNIDLKVREALHNELMARMASAELRFITGSTRPVKAFMDAARRVAEQQLMRIKMKNFKPKAFSSAAQKSSKLALKHIKKGAQLEAAQAKQMQLLQSEMARIGTSMLWETNAWLAKVSKYRKAGFHESVGADTAEQVRYILARFRVGPVAPRPAASLVEHLEKMAEEGFFITTTEGLLNDEVTMAFDDLNMRQAKDLMDLVDKLVFTGKRLQEMTKSEAIDSINARAKEMADSINAKIDRTASVQMNQTKIERARSMLKKTHWAHITMGTIARLLDGGKDNGPVWNILVKQANKHSDNETRDKIELDKFLESVFKPIYEKLQKKDDRFSDAKVFIPELVGTRRFPDGSLTRNVMFSILLNYGNEGNASRMAAGDGFTEAQIMAVISRMTKAELLAAQAIGDYFEKFKSEVARIERKMHGKEPEWVEPRPFKITSADGFDVDLRGWYFPVRYDPEARGGRSWDKSVAKAFGMGEKSNIMTEPVTMHGYTKPRAEELQNAGPLFLDTSVIFSGMNEVIHDVNWREFLLEAAHIVERKNFRDAVEEHYGREMYAEITKWLDEVAVSHREAEDPVTRAFAILTSNVTFSRMALNFMTAALQPLGFLQSIVRLGQGNVAEGARVFSKGLNEFRKSPGKAYQIAYSKSTLLETRGTTMLRDLDELRNEFRGELKSRKWLMTNGFAMIAKMQSLIDVITWMGKYREEVAFVGEDQAAALADQIVIDSQGSGRRADMARVMRQDGVLRLFTAFYTFPNVTLNLGYTALRTTKNKAQLTAEMFLLMVLPSALEQMLRDALQPKGGDDEEEDLWLKSRIFAGDIVEYALGSYVGLREFAGVGHELLQTGKGFAYRGPSRTAVIPDVLAFGKQVGQLDADKALLKATLTLLGSIMGIPSAQANKIVDAWVAFEEGDIEGAEIIPAALFGVEK